MTKPLLQPGDVIQHSQDGSCQLLMVKRIVANIDVPTNKYLKWPVVREKYYEMLRWFPERDWLFKMKPDLQTTHPQTGQWLAPSNFLISRIDPAIDSQYIFKCPARQTDVKVIVHKLSELELMIRQIATMAQYQDLNRLWTEYTAQKKQNGL